MRYDYILAGGGAAGLSLANHLVHSPLKEHTILIIDQDQKAQNDRTWCFWTTQPTLYDDILYRTWTQIRIVSDDFSGRYHLAPYQYHMLRGIDFYNHVRSILARFPNVHFVQGNISRIEDGTDHACVWVNDIPYEGRWVFNSLFLANNYAPKSNRNHYLMQHFKGWEIRTTRDYFDPSAATMFDFRTPQHHAMRFLYVLPYTPQHALIEYTLFSANRLSPAEYEQGLKTYIEDTLNISTYSILNEENGVIPMTDQPFPRRASPHILNTGTRG
jgi:lycopene beta-cyclase